jgi:hypothetical protein
MPLQGTSDEQRRNVSDPTSIAGHVHQSSAYVVLGALLGRRTEATGEELLARLP